VVPSYLHQTPALKSQAAISKESGAVLGMPGHRFHKQGAFRKETKYRADPRQTLDLHLAAPKLRESCDLAGAQLVPPQDRQETAGYNSGTHRLSFFFFFFFFFFKKSVC
jgi:hypothetical protein